MYIHIYIHIYIYIYIYVCVCVCMYTLYIPQAPTRQNCLESTYRPPQTLLGELVVRDEARGWGNSPAPYTLYYSHAALNLLFTCSPKPSKLPRNSI